MKRIVLLAVLLMGLAKGSVALAEESGWTSIIHVTERLDFWTKPLQVMLLGCQEWQVYFYREIPNSPYLAEIILNHKEDGYWVPYDSHTLSLGSPPVPEEIWWPQLEYKQVSGQRWLYVSTGVDYKVLGATEACKVHLPVVFRPNWVGTILDRLVAPAEVEEGSQYP